MYGVRKQIYSIQEFILVAFLLYVHELHVFCLHAQLTLLVRGKHAHTVETLSCTTITSGIKLSGQHDS